MLAGHFLEGADYSCFRIAGTTDHLLIHTLSGAGRIGGVRDGLTLGPGDAVLWAPGTRHEYATATATDGRDASHWEFFFAHFHPRVDWLPLLDWPPRSDGGDAPGPGVIGTDGDVRRRVDSALRRSSRAGRGVLASAELFAMNALEEALLWLDTQNPMTTRTDERIVQVLEYVTAHLADRLDVGTLAQVAHLSVSRLGHLFVEHLGVSPQRHVEQERMRLAEQFLALTDRPISAVARATGWADPLYFSSRFQHHHGMSPTRYRRSSRAGAG